MDEPLIAIIGQLSKELHGENWKDLSKTVKEIWNPLAKKLLLGRIGLHEADLKSAGKLAFDSYMECHAESESLKSNLREIIKSNKDSKGQSHPLVFIVDELDRCTPTFAIKTLERIKHFFSIPGIVFIFGVNKKSLKESIRKIYGNIDGDDYLRRFFHLDLVLPKVEASV